MCGRSPSEITTLDFRNLTIAFQFSDWFYLYREYPFPAVFFDFGKSKHGGKRVLNSADRGKKCALGFIGAFRIFAGFLSFQFRCLTSSNTRFLMPHPHCSDR
jgi:hypothetical protein